MRRKITGWLAVVIVATGLAACEPKPIEQREVIGQWDAVRLARGYSVKPTLIFRQDGTFVGSSVPAEFWNGSDRRAQADVRGRWEITQPNEGSAPILISIEEAGTPPTPTTSFGNGFFVEGRPHHRTLVYFIGDPDSADAFYFRRVE